MSEQKLSLYIWPHHWNLPSFDTDCLACVFYLQLNFAGRYQLVECTDPDLSPSGSLPFLIHNSKKIATKMSILNYLAKLKAEEGGTKGNGDDVVRAQRTAWNAYVNRQLRDLVNHVLYANAENYRAGVHTALAQVLPVPSRYYLPARLREEIRSDLEPVGLWKLEDDEENKPKKGPFDKPTSIVDEKDQIIRDAFGKEKLLEKARNVFDLLNPLLGHRSFFLSSQPTTLDAQIASYILIISHAPIPHNPVQPLLNEFYPGMIDHSERMLSLAFPPSHNGASTIPQVTQAPHANPAIQIGRALGRMIGYISPVHA